MKVICPECAVHLGNDVKGKVYKCRHCGEIFSVGDEQQTASSDAGTVVESSSKRVSLPEVNSVSPHETGRKYQMKCINCSNPVDNKDEFRSYSFYSFVGFNIQHEHYLTRKPEGGHSIFTPLRKYTIFTSICNNCKKQIEIEHYSNEEKEKEKNKKDFKGDCIKSIISLTVAFVALLCIVIFNLKWYFYVIPIVATIVAAFFAFFALIAWDISKVKLSKKEILNKFVFDEQKLAVFFNYIYENESLDGIYFNYGWDRDRTSTSDVSMLIVDVNNFEFYGEIEWLSHNCNRHWYHNSSTSFGSSPYSYINGYNSDGERSGFRYTFGPFPHIGTESSAICNFYNNKHIKNTIGLIKDDKGIQQCDADIIDEAKKQ